MMQLLCDGVRLDLPDGAKFAWKKTNILFAFDKAECERSLSFDLPPTPTNNRVLNFAKNPQGGGDGMRRRFDARLMDGLVVKDGYLYVDKYDGKNYKAIFITGEYLGLLKIRNAGKLAELAELSDTLLWSASTPPNLPTDADARWAMVRYNQQGVPCRPSLGIKAVVDAIVSSQHLPAITFPTGYDKLRVIIAMPARLSSVKINFARAIDGYWSLAASYPHNRVATQSLTASETITNLWETVDTYEAAYRYHYQNYDQSLHTDLYEGHVQHIAFKQAIKMTFPSDFPSDVYVGYFEDAAYAGGFTFFGDRSFYKMYDFTHNQPKTVREGSPLAGRTIEIARGQAFTFVRESDMVDYTQYTENTGTTISWSQGWRDVRSAMEVTGVTVEGDGDAETGDTIRLRDSLPGITLVELLRAVAAGSGRVLNYSEADGLTFDNVDFSQFKHLQVAKPIAIADVQRKFGDYAQNNIVSFNSDKSLGESERVHCVYTIDNVNIKADNELQKVPFSEGGLGYDNGVPVVEVASDNETDTIADANTYSYRMKRITLPKNANIQLLCTRSTGVTLRAAMTRYEFDQVETRSRLYYDGVHYVWTSAEWSNGVAKLALAKI